MTRTLLLALSLAAPLASSAAPVPKVKPKVASHPTTVGTKWEYVRGGNAMAWVEEVIQSEARDGVTTFQVRNAIDGREQCVDTYTLKDGVLSVTANSAAGTYTPPRLMWASGMTAGTIMETAWALRTPGGPHTGCETLTFGEAKEITTPAGTFLATPITRSTKGFNEGTVLWYADGVGLVRHTEPGLAEPVLELKAFTPGTK